MEVTEEYCTTFKTKFEKEFVNNRVPVKLTARLLIDGIEENAVLSYSIENTETGQNKEITDTSETIYYILIELSDRAMKYCSENGLKLISY